MHVRLSRSFIVNFIGDTLHLLLLIVAFTAGSFSGGCSRRGIEIAALEYSSPTMRLLGGAFDDSPTTATTTTATASVATSIAAIRTTAKPKTTEAAEGEAASGRGTVHATITAIVQATSAAAMTTSTGGGTATLRAYGSNSGQSYGNDASVIDGLDYGRTRHKVSHAISTSMDYLQQLRQHHPPPHRPHQQLQTHPQHHFQPLSSLSLLSPNATSSSSSTDSLADTSRTGSTRSGSGGYATDGTYRHQIGLERIALNMPTTPALAATNASGGSSDSSAGRTNARTSAKRVETKYMLPKPQKTDAPMLNYIFDTFSTNKHHHHDQRYGPHFEDVQRVGQPTNITVQAGSSVHLNCRISLLQDKTVSWVRRNGLGGDESALDLLTVGLHRYTGKERYQLEFQYPNNWRLKIANVKKDDEAVYECQISTHPPRVIQINLHVNAPKVMIVDEFGDPLQEKYYEIDSTLQLACMVRNIAMTTSVVYWKHGDDVLNYDVKRGGVSVKTELMEDGANSTLSIAKINKADSGNYTCSITDFQNFSIVVHILNGESFAELHHGGAAVAYLGVQHTLALNVVVLLLLLHR